MLSTLRGMLIKGNKKKSGSKLTLFRNTACIPMLSSDHYNLIKNSLLGSLLEGFEYPITITSSAYRLIYANKAFCKTYGYKVEQIIGLSPKILVPKHTDSKMVIDIQRQVMVRKKPYIGELINMTSRNKEFPIFLLLTPLIPLSSNFPVAHLAATCDPSKKEALMMSFLSHVGNFTYTYNTNIKHKKIQLKSYQRGDRQAEIVKLSHLGYSTKEIASVMGISVSTVGFVKWKMAKKMQTK
jgi:PAS domain S-box-containing protein